MKVGIYFDMRNPAKWAVDPARLYSFTLELCEEAERLGADSVWFSEHHMFADGYLTQPLVMAAAAAARTKTVRIGTAVVVAPFRTAAHIAEEAAVVDLISGGRLDLGLGAGYRVPEFELFDADVDTRYTTTIERVRQLRQIWSEGALTPMPVQQRVPIWLGFQGPKGVRRVGLTGEGLLSADARLWPAYRDALIEGGHPDGTGTMSGVIQAFVSDDPDADWPVVSQHLAYQLDSYRHYLVEGTGAPQPRPVDPDVVRARPIGGTLGYFLHAAPDEAAARIIEHTSGAPVDTVFIFVSLAGLDESMVVRHLQTICTKLKPLLAHV